LLAIISSFSIARADTIDIRNPFDTGAVVTSEWDHPSAAIPPYAERSLDLVYSGGRNVVNAPVISHVNNLNVGKNIYYDVFDYGGSCHGVKHVMYERVGTSSTLTYVGTVVYLHIYGYTTGNYVYIAPGATEYRTVGWVRNGDCGALPHLHHGRVTGSGSLNHASWLGSWVASGLNADLISNDITLYK
jgi:hypothetical protein